MKGRKNPIVYPIEAVTFITKNGVGIVKDKEKHFMFQMTYTINEKKILAKLKEINMSRCASHCACRQSCHSFSFADHNQICTLYNDDMLVEDSAGKLMSTIPQYYKILRKSPI